jgi:cobyrinic acid a,c-diamide synthase
VTKTLVITGPATGVGKTMVTLGVMAALRRRGLTVQGFKVGPDFIDPAFHALVTGRPSYTLDGWMCGRDAVRATVARHTADADVAVIEGMMGCFDGVDGVSETGSTAEIAKWLDAPVVLVVDASASVRSAAAVVYGFERFDPNLDLAAVIVNKTGGAVHGGWVLDAIRGRCRAVPLGALARDAALTVPERHLGLVTAAEGPLSPERQATLADALEGAVDIGRLLGIAKVAPPAVRARPAETPRRTAPPRARIGVARDLGFQFYYEENLSRLREAGAELVFWSPETDAAVPDVDGLYLGGGYPELRAKALAANTAVRLGVRTFVESGGPVYAECGGLMYLAEALEDDEGITHEMAGVLPAIVRMRPRRLSLGYTTVTTLVPSLLGPAGTVARGHEFHYSTIGDVPSSIARVCNVADTRGNERQEGYQVGNALISYVHLHFGSNPAVAPALVDACARRRA